MEAEPANRRRGLERALLLSLAIWLMLRQVDGVLGYLQSSGGGGYGANDLYALSPSGLPEQVRDLLAVWERTRPVSHVAFGAYTGLDVVFICLYTAVFLLLFRRLGSPEHPEHPIDRALGKAPWVVCVLAVADFLEDVLRLAMVAFNDSSNGLVYVAWLATTVKWLTLATVLLLLVRAWQTVGLSAGPGRWTADSSWALGRLRVPAFFVTVFGLVLIFDPTGQVSDSFRRWMDGPAKFVTSAVFTAGGVALLGLATWTTTRRAVLGNYHVATRPLRPRRWGIAAIVLGIAAIGFGLPNLAGLAITIGVVAALEVWWLVFGSRAGKQQEREQKALEQRARESLASKHQGELAGAPTDPRQREVHRVARALGTWPFLALILGLIAAWTVPPVVLMPLEHDTIRAGFCVLGAATALGLLAAVAGRVPERVWALDTGSPRPDRPAVRIQVRRRRVTLLPACLEIRHLIVAAVCVVLCAAAILRPLDFPSLMGSVGMTAVILALFIVLLGEAQRYGDTHPPNAGLTFVGFRRLPVVLLLLVALTIASLLDDGSYHSVRGNGQPPPGPYGTDLETAFANWSRRNCASLGGRERFVPMVFVASQGGGIRAAYWTSSVLTEVLGSPSREDADCAGASPFGRVFAMGGASGGSVGITSYSGHANTGRQRWFRDVMGDTDFVAVPVSWGLLVDLPRSLIGFEGPDRQRRFEEVWEREDQGLTKDFFAGHSPNAPILMLSGTQVETGCRMNISPLRLTVATDSQSQGECAALDRPASGRDDRSPSSLHPAAALTSDVLDFLCEESIDRSTAALTSARFPYVSPSGQLTKCRGGRTIAVVDGGYAENTGGQPILNLWARLKPLVAAHNEKRDTARIVPVFVDIDNHYSKAARAEPGERTPQLLVPPLTAARTDGLDNRGVEQLADAEFSTALPGTPDTTCRLGNHPAQRFVRLAPTENPSVQAPLGWTLSQMSMDDLDRQRAEALALTPAVNLRAFLTDGTIDCQEQSTDVHP